MLGGFPVFPPLFAPLVPQPHRGYFSVTKSSPAIRFFASFRSRVFWQSRISEVLNLEAMSSVSRISSHSFNGLFPFERLTAQFR